MARFFTSDTHFGHRNVINYCNRPWDTVQEMDEAIIVQWNSQVKPNDDVFHLGDVGIGKKTSLDKNLISKLNGNKYLILGNHDACFNTLHKSPDCVHTHAKIAKKYLEAGWNYVNIVHYLMLKDGTHVVLTHLPPNNEYDTRYSDYKIQNNPNFRYLHGHLHAHYLKKSNMIDVAFDGNLKLYTEDEVLSLIHDKRDFIPSRITDYYGKSEAITLQPFEKERKKGNIRRQDDSSGKLCLYNYTDQCVYDGIWNDVTQSSRGIVFEVTTGKVVALPFKKFYNLGEMPETRLENLPNEPYEVFEKMDGSLGIIYNYEGKWRVNTRGSFDSDQAKKAAELLTKYNTEHLVDHLTYLVEIVYPENKIVINYGSEEKLVLLAIFDRDKQAELDRDIVEYIANCLNMPVCKKYNYTITEMVELQKTMPKDQEGFVVRFKSGLRVKIKGQEYLKLHRLLSNMTPLNFWEYMSFGKVALPFLHELPEEYRPDAENIRLILETKYEKQLDYLDSLVDNVIKVVGFGDINDPIYRKQIGQYIQTNKIPETGYIFSRLYGKKEACDRILKNRIRPKGNNF